MSNNKQSGNASQSQPQSPSPQAGVPDVNDLMARLAAKEAEVEQLKSQQAMGFAGSSGGGGMKSIAPVTKGKQWTFVVVACGAENGRPIEIRGEVKACDESEALRMFYLVDENGNPRSQHYDPSNFNARVTCIDKDRLETIRRQYIETKPDAPYIPLALKG